MYPNKDNSDASILNPVINASTSTPVLATLSFVDDQLGSAQQQAGPTDASSNSLLRISRPITITLPILLNIASSTKDGAPTSATATVPLKLLREASRKKFLDFMALPPELRNMVYNLASPTFSHQRPCPVSQSPLGLLLVSKTISKEFAEWRRTQGIYSLVFKSCNDDTCYEHPRSYAHMMDPQSEIIVHQGSKPKDLLHDDHKQAISQFRKLEIYFLPDNVARNPHTGPPRTARTPFRGEIVPIIADAVAAAIQRASDTNAYCSYEVYFTWTATSVQSPWQAGPGRGMPGGFGGTVVIPTIHDQMGWMTNYPGPAAPATQTPTQTASHTALQQPPPTAPARGLQNWVARLGRKMRRIEVLEEVETSDEEKQTRTLYSYVRVNGNQSG